MNEFESFITEIRKQLQDGLKQLDSGSSESDSNVYELSDEDLAQTLKMSVGKYIVQESLVSTFVDKKEEPEPESAPLQTVTIRNPYYMKKESPKMNPNKRIKLHDSEHQITASEIAMPSTELTTTSQTVSAELKNRGLMSGVNENISKLSQVRKHTIQINDVSYDFKVVGPSTETNVDDSTLANETKNVSTGLKIISPAAESEINSNCEKNNLESNGNISGSIKIGSSNSQQTVDETNQDNSNENLNDSFVSEIFKAAKDIDMLEETDNLQSQTVQLAFVSSANENPPIDNVTVTNGNQINNPTGNGTVTNSNQVSAPIDPATATNAIPINNPPVMVINSLGGGDSVNAMDVDTNIDNQNEEPLITVQGEYIAPNIIQATDGNIYIQTEDGTLLQVENNSEGMAFELLADGNLQQLVQAIDMSNIDNAEPNL